MDEECFVMFVCLIINSFSTMYSTFVVIRHWLTHYWDHDFSKSRTLRFILSTFLSELRSHPTILGSPRDARIIKSLRNLFKRQRKQKQEDMQSSDRTSLSTTPGLFDTRRSSNSGGMMIEEHRRKDSGFGNIQQHHGRPNSTSSSSSTTISSSPWATRVSSSLKSIKRSMWHRASSSLTSATSDEIHYPSPQPSISTPIPSHTTKSSSRHQSHYSYPPNLTPSPSHRLLRTSPLGMERLSATIFGSDTNNSKSTYRPFILHYRTETVAQQFCMIERQMLQYVTWDELVELRWKDRRSGAASRSPIVDDGTKEQSGVEQLIGYFNRVSINGCVCVCV